MSVQNYVPGNESVSMTESAIAQARSQLAREGALGLRLSVKPSGCSGYMYVLDLVREEQPSDRRYTFGGDVNIYVDAAALGVINGTEIDYVKEGLNAFFKFRNPNVTGECGCGESFTVN
ncbi:MAG: HesB/IscA family protein [Gammaproteobacteria bacterium]